MFKEKLDALVREHRLRQKIASIEIYAEAKTVWKKIEDLLLETVRRDLNLTPLRKCHTLEICCIETDIVYSDDHHYMKYLLTENKNCSEILNAIIEIAKNEGIQILKNDLPSTRYLINYLSDSLPIEVEIYELIYQSPSEK